jgi:type IX secretion system PorP/SprF family membrane protein
MLHAQEAQFTMFNNNPLLLNPANTGSFSGDWRVAGNFRNQWAATTSPFRTASVSADAKLYILNQKIGAGLFFLNDESGIGGLTFNKLYASLAYEYRYKENYLTIGLQAGYVFGSINSWTNWNPVTGSFDAPSGEINFSDKISYFDLNAGIRWKRNIGIFEPNAGLAFYHLNRPNKSFFEGDEKEEIQFVFHVDVKTKLNDEFYLLPAILVKGKGSSSQTIAGTNIGYNFLGSRTSVKQIFAGVYVKNGILKELDAISVLAGTTVRRIDIALSYDFSMSNLSKSAGKMMGAFEISFIYNSISTVLNSYSIPCERY